MFINYSKAQGNVYANMHNDIDDKSQCNKYPALLGHYIEDGFMQLNVKPLSDHFKMIGPAFPIHFSGRNSAMLFYAMRRAPEGSILVIDRGGDKQFACVGEGVARIAKSLKLGGILINGPSTDTLGIKKLGFPVFSTGISPVTTTSRMGEVNGSYGTTIQCAGVTVNPGDIIFGDIDGVIVAPPDQFESLLIRAEEATAKEKVFFSSIENTNFRERPFESEPLVEKYLKNCDK